MQFLERLDDEARKLVLAVARPVSYAKGARLVRHGETARGAYVLGSGSAEAVVILPGGEKLSVATLGAGAVFGETSLLEHSTCTATVNARESIEGWFIERDDFRSLVAQRVPAALRVQHAVTLVLSDKLRALNARVLEVPAPGDRVSAGPSIDADPLAGVERAKKAPFDYRCRAAPHASSCLPGTRCSPPASLHKPASSWCAARSRSARAVPGANAAWRCSAPASSLAT